MRTWCCLVALASIAVACGCSGTNDPPPTTEPARGNGANTGPAGYQCAAAPRVPVTQREPGAVVGDASPWFVGGPSGVRAYATLIEAQELRWNDGRRSVPVPAALLARESRPIGVMREGRLAWTGSRYLVVSSEREEAGDPDLALEPDWRNHRVFTTDAAHGDVRAVRAPIPPNACDVRVTETGAGALVTWFRRTGDGCAEGGDAWAMAFDGRGEPVGVARALTFAGAPVHVRSLSARWDFGRAVVSGRGDRAVSWVLDVAGATVAAEDSGDVACPRAGCARVRVEAERTNTDGQPGGATSLRFEPLGAERFGAHRSFHVRLQQGTVRGLAVSGDLLLVLHSPQGGGCDLSILDLEQRAVVAEHHEDSTRACDERHVRALPRGFALAGFELPAGPFTVSFDCTRPPR